MVRQTAEIYSCTDGRIFDCQLGVLLDGKLRDPARNFPICDNCIQLSVLIMV